MALGSEHGRVSLVGAGREALPPGAVRDGAVHDPQEVGTGLARLLGRLGVRSRPVSLAIGGSSVLIKRFPAPAKGSASGQEEKSGFREAVAREAARHVPLHLESLEFDYEGPLPATPAATNATGRPDPGAVVFGAAPRETIRAQCHAMQLAGCEVSRVEIEPFALFAAARLSAQFDAERAGSEAFAIVEIGATRASVYIFRRCPEPGPSALMVNSDRRSAGEPGDLLASVMARGVGAPAPGVTPDPGAPARFGPAGAPVPVEPGDDGWSGPGGARAAVSADRVVAALRDGLGEAEIEHAVEVRISGGGAGIPGMSGRLGEVAQTEPAVLDPLERLGFEEPGSAFAVAAGLAHQQLLELSGSKAPWNRQP